MTRNVDVLVRDFPIFTYKIHNLVRFDETANDKSSLRRGVGKTGGREGGGHRTTPGKMPLTETSINYTKLPERNVSANSVWRMSRLPGKYSRNVRTLERVTG